MIFRVLDIETVPDERWEPPRAAYRLVPRPGDVLPPEAGAEVVDVVPPPQACRVVAISTVDVGFDPSHSPSYFFEGCATICRYATDVAEADRVEREMICDFASLMGDASGTHLVTWNGRGFDLPVIMMRSLRHGVAQKWYYQLRDMRYRFSAEGHCDLMDYLGDYGSARYMRLDDVAKSCGLPGKTDTSGAMVADVLREAAARGVAELEEAVARVARYCLHDTLQTALVWLRSRVLLGKIVPQTHDSVLDTFRASEKVTGAIDLPWDRLYLAREAA